MLSLPVLDNGSHWMKRVRTFPVDSYIHVHTFRQKTADPAPRRRSPGWWPSWHRCSPTSPMHPHPIQIFDIEGAADRPEARRSSRVDRSKSRHHHVLRLQRIFEALEAELIAVMQSPTSNATLGTRRENGNKVSGRQPDFARHTEKMAVHRSGHRIPSAPFLLVVTGIPWARQGEISTEGGRKPLE